MPLSLVLNLKLQFFMGYSIDSSSIIGYLLFIDKKLNNFF